MTKFVDIIIPKQQSETISVTCSCLKCDSISCFAKRRLCEPCACENCNTCRYFINKNEIRKHHSDQITAVYLNAAKRKLNNKVEELTEHDINYESERQRILATNQPPPHSLNEYVDRLLSVTKISSKHKHKPSSLSGYISMISENSEYKKKMNLLKEYVQSLKEAKLSTHSEDLENFETFTDAISPKLYRYQQLSEKRRGKCKSKCKGKCKHKQTLKNLDITQAQSVMISCPHINRSPGTKSQTNNYGGSICSVTRRTNELPTSKENSFFNYDILNKLKEAYRACSCKVCECIPTKLTKDDVCNCKPCECAECTNSKVPQTSSSAYKLSPNLNCYCYQIDNNQTKLQPLKEKKECFCGPCECAQCVKNDLSYQNEEVISNRYTACTCLPCDCIECNHRNGAGRVFSKKQLYNFNHPTTSINEIYHHGNTSKKNNNQHDIVTMYAGIASLNTNVGFENKYPKSCICRECECLKCVCKEDTINSIKSSRFFSYDKHNENESSIIESSAIYMKPNYSYIYNTPKPCENIRKRIHQSYSNHAPCCACDECIRLEKEMPLHYCKCSACRCERCYGHANALISNYSDIAGACLVKKGDVLTASAHQTKIQKEMSKGNTAPEIREYKSPCVNLNSNVNPQCEDIDSILSKNKYPQDLTHQTNIRQVKKDTGTMCTKPFDRWGVLQCDAYVHSQTWNISKPLLKNNFTNVRPGSYTSINSINRSPSIEKVGSQSRIENKNSSYHGDPDNSVQFPKPIIENLECDPKIELKLNIHGSIPALTKISSVKQNDFNNILTEASPTNAKDYETCMGFEPTNSKSCIEVPKIDLKLDTHGSIPVPAKVLSVKQNNCTNILTEASSALVKDSETPGCEPTNSISCIEVPKIELKLDTHGGIPALAKVLSVKQNDCNNILTEASSAHVKDCEPLECEPTNLISCIEVPRIDLKLDTHGSIPALTKVLSVKQNNCNNILAGASLAHDKDYETQAYEPTNLNSSIEVPKIDLKFDTHGSIPALGKVISVEQNDCNNILTEASSARVKHCETRRCEPIISNSSIKACIECDESRRNEISDCNSKNKLIDNSNSNTETKIHIQKDETCQPNKLTLEPPNELQSKCYSVPALTSHDSLKTNDLEVILNDKSSKSSNHNGDNYNCFHMIENYTKYSPNGYVYTHKKLPKENLPDCMANNLLGIDDDYRSVRKTLADAQKFSLHLINVLKMYEKANKEFEKVSDKLKMTYEAVFGDKISLKHEKCDINLDNFTEILHSNNNLYLNETTIPDYKQTVFENIIIKRSDDCRRISQKQELTNISKAISNQNSSYMGYGILEKVNVINKRQNVFNAHKNIGMICYDNVHNKPSNEIEKLNYITTPDYESTFPTHEDETVAEITTQQPITEEYFKPIENIELRSSRTTSMDYPEKDTQHKILVDKEVETKMVTVSMNSFGCTAKPITMDKGEEVNGFPSLEVGVRDIEIHKNSTLTIKNEISHHENKALNQLHSEVKKLLELTILEQLNFIEDTADSLKKLSTIIVPQSFSNVVNVKINQGSNKQMVHPAADVTKDIGCDGQNFMKEFKKQIREELQVACAHPLLKKSSNLGSYTSNGECEDQKARFLVVRKVSEHTALVRWSEPRELLGVKGYELLVDGRTIQKIFNPAKCITAVTCLPHTDKILLTIRTITSVLPDAGHYPSTTIIYRPRLQ